MTFQEYTSAAQMRVAHKERQLRIWSAAKPIMMARVAKAKGAVPIPLLRSMSIRIRIAGWKAWDEVLFLNGNTIIHEPITCERIVRLVCQIYDVTKTDLLSDRRTRELVKPRQIACYLAKQLTPRSLPEIGRKLGGRDHTTVLHAIRKVEAMRGDDLSFDAEIASLERMLTV